MSNQPLCPFCDGTQQYRYLTELKYTRALYPKSPACKYHILLVPKRHVSLLDELNSDEFNELTLLLKKLVAVGKTKVPDFIGYNILSNNGGPLVNQRVPHCHIHVFLRTTADKGNPVVGKHKGNPKPLSGVELDNLAQLKNWLSAT